MQDEEKLESLLDKLDAQNDRKIPLDAFLDAGIGVCRQDGLACAALLEQFRRDGYLRGKISVDRNSMKRGAHVWCRYECYSGEVFALDVAQRYFGRADSANAAWDYNRP